MKKLAIINTLNGVYDLLQYGDDLYLLDDDEPIIKPMSWTNGMLWDFFTFTQELIAITNDNEYEVYSYNDDFTSYIINNIESCEDEQDLYFIGNHFFKKHDKNYIFNHCIQQLKETELI